MKGHYADLRCMLSRIQLHMRARVNCVSSSWRALKMDVWYDQNLVWSRMSHKWTFKHYNTLRVLFHHSSVEVSINCDCMCSQNPRPCAAQTWPTRTSLRSRSNLDDQLMKGHRNKSNATSFVIAIQINLGRAISPSIVLTGTISWSFLSCATSLWLVQSDLSCTCFSSFDNLSETLRRMKKKIFCNITRPHAPFAFHFFYHQK